VILDKEKIRELKDKMYNCSNAVRMSPSLANDIIDTIEALQQENEKLKADLCNDVYFLIGQLNRNIFAVDVAEVKIEEQGGKTT